MDSIREGRRQHTIAAVLTAAAALLPAAGPAPASELRVEFDDTSAELVIKALERGSVNDRTLRSILDSGGYSLMFDHLSGRTMRPPDDWRAEFRDALRASVAGEEDPGFALHLVRGRTADYRRALAEVRRLSPSVRWRVVERLNAYLPPSSDFTSRAYFVVGGDSAGLAFGHRNDIALRLDDFVGEDPGAIDTDRLASVLTHELFHVGFRTAGGLPPRPAEFDRGWQELMLRYGSETVGEVWRASGLRHWDTREIHARLDAWVPPAEWDVLSVDQFIAILARIQNEGSATYVDAPLRDPGETQVHAGEVRRWMENIDADWDFFSRIIKRLNQGAGPVEIARLGNDGFRDNGPLYRVGYSMAERIDGFAGRRPFLETVSGGPFTFFENYLQTHPYGPGQIPSYAEAEVRRLTRTVRAMGEFDPEE